MTCHLNIFSYLSASRSQKFIGVHFRISEAFFCQKLNFLKSVKIGFLGYSFFKTPIFGQILKMTSGFFKTFKIRGNRPLSFFKSDFWKKFLNVLLICGHFLNLDENKLFWKKKYPKIQFLTDFKIGSNFLAKKCKIIKCFWNPKMTSNFLKKNLIFLEAIFGEEKKVVWNKRPWEVEFLSIWKFLKIFQFCRKNSIFENR